MELKNLVSRMFAVLIGQAPQGEDKEEQFREAVGNTIDDDEEQWRRLSGDTSRDLAPMT